MQLKWLLFSLNIILFIYCTYQNLRVSLGRYGKYTWKEQFFDIDTFMSYGYKVAIILSAVLDILSLLSIYQFFEYGLFTYSQLIKCIVLSLIFFVFVICLCDPEIFVEDNPYTNDNRYTYLREKIVIFMWLIEIIAYLVFNIL